jgi:hypothetical protein
MTARLIKLTTDLVAKLGGPLNSGPEQPLVAEIKRELELARRSAQKPSAWQEAHEASAEWMEQASARLAELPQSRAKHETLDALKVAYQRGRGQGAAEHFRPVSTAPCSTPYSKPAVAIWERAFIAAISDLSHAVTKRNPDHLSTKRIAEEAASIADHAGAEWRQRCGGPSD